MRAPKNHGYSKTTEYRTWKAIRSRCNNPNHKDYPIYGGRGIKVCSRWNTFSNFLQDMGMRPKLYSIDRIDPNKNYSPENCRWADTKTQTRNKRSNIYFNVFGESLVQADACKKLGVPYGTFKSRLRRGWTKQRALFEPIKGREVA